MERPAFAAVFALEVGADHFTLTRRDGAFKGLTFKQISDLRCVLFDPGEVVIVIGDDADQAVVGERAMQLA